MNRAHITLSQASLTGNSVFVEVGVEKRHRPAAAAQAAALVITTLWNYIALNAWVFGRDETTAIAALVLQRSAGTRS